ncbi:MAG: glycogen debranching N-terminal domain-containing protein, partial [Pseudonocardia sediminis]
MTARQPLLHDLSVVLRAPTVCLSGADGQIRADGVQGVFCGDVRVLDRAVVTIDGVEPEPVGGGPRGASSEERIGLLRGLGDPGADPTVWLRRTRTAHPDGLEESFVLVNRSASDLDVELVVTVGADLAPIETVKQGLPTEPAEPITTDGGPTWTTTDVTARIAAPGAEVDAGRLRWWLGVRARSVATAGWSLQVSDSGAVVAPART